MTPIQDKIAFLEDYFNNKCGADDFAKAFEYMNCIKLKELETTYIYDDIIYQIVRTDNDGFELNDTISWSDMSTYIDLLVQNGIQDDIDVLYCFLTNNN